jgi:hypothetical protein
MKTVLDPPAILTTPVKMQIEWIEMPQLKITLRQAARLWSLPDDVCDTAFATLVRKGFLVQEPNGVYVRQPMS